MFVKNILHPPKCVNHQQNLQPNLVCMGLSIVAVALFLFVMKDPQIDLVIHIAVYAIYITKVSYMQNGG